MAGKLNAAFVSAGFNYTYGARATGRPETLEQECRDAGIDVAGVIKVTGGMPSVALDYEASGAEWIASSRLEQLALGGLNVALVSDAGTPGISDPGFLLARTCAEEGIEVQTLPGATACIPAIVSSGLPCDRFAFEGFLPQKKGRQTHLQELAKETRTMVFYESPYRLVKTLEQFIEFFGPERPCSVAREISKVHEEHKRGTLDQVAQWFREHEPKGEIVIVVAGAQPVKPSKQKRYGRGEEETQQP